MAWSKKLKTEDAIKQEIEGDDEDDEDDTPANRSARELGTAPIKKKEEKIRPLVVAELPTKVARKMVDPNTGEQFEAMTVVEALQEILESVREIKRP